MSYETHRQNLVDFMADYVFKLLVRELDGIISHFRLGPVRRKDEKVREVLRFVCDKNLEHEKFLQVVNMFIGYYQEKKRFLPKRVDEAVDYFRRNRQPPAASDMSNSSRMIRLHVKGKDPPVTPKPSRPGVHNYEEAPFGVMPSEDELNRFQRREYFHYLIRPDHIPEFERADYNPFPNPSQVYNMNPIISPYVRTEESSYVPLHHVVSSRSSAAPAPSRTLRFFAPATFAWNNMCVCGMEVYESQPYVLCTSLRCGNKYHQACADVDPPQHQDSVYRWRCAVCRAAAMMPCNILDRSLCPTFLVKKGPRLRLENMSWKQPYSPAEMQKRNLGIRLLCIPTMPGEKSETFCLWPETATDLIINQMTIPVPQKARNANSAPLLDITGVCHSGKNVIHVNLQSTPISSASYYIVVAFVQQFDIFPLEPLTQHILNNQVLNPNLARLAIIASHQLSSRPGGTWRGLKHTDLASVSMLWLSYYLASLYNQRVAIQQQLFVEFELARVDKQKLMAFSKENMTWETLQTTKKSNRQHASRLPANMGQNLAEGKRSSQTITSQSAVETTEVPNDFDSYTLYPFSTYSPMLSTYPDHPLDQSIELLRSCYLQNPILHSMEEWRKYDQKLHAAESPESKDEQYTKDQTGHGDEQAMKGEAGESLKQAKNDTEDHGGSDVAPSSQTVPGTIALQSVVASQPTSSLVPALLPSSPITQTSTTSQTTFDSVATPNRAPNSSPVTPAANLSPSAIATFAASSVPSAPTTPSTIPNTTGTSSVSFAASSAATASDTTTSQYSSPEKSMASQEFPTPQEVPPSVRSPPHNTSLVQPPPPPPASTSNPTGLSNPPLTITTTATAALAPSQLLSIQQPSQSASPSRQLVKLTTAMPPTPTSNATPTAHGTVSQLSTLTIPPHGTDPLSSAQSPSSIDSVAIPNNPPLVSPSRNISLPAVGLPRFPPNTMYPLPQNQHQSNTINPYHYAYFLQQAGRLMQNAQNPYGHQMPYFPPNLMQYQYPQANVTQNGPPSNVPNTVPQATQGSTASMHSFPFPYNQPQPYALPHSQQSLPQLPPHQQHQHQQPQFSQYHQSSQSHSQTAIHPTPSASTSSSATSVAPPSASTSTPSSSLAALPYHPPPPTPSSSTRQNTRQTVFRTTSANLQDMTFPVHEFPPVPGTTSVEIENEVTTLRLRDPLALTAVAIPVRGEHCQHIQCFDLRVYLQSNSQQSARWKCPLCQRPTMPSSIWVDTYQLLLLLAIGQYGTYQGGYFELNETLHKHLMHVQKHKTLPYPTVSASEDLFQTVAKGLSPPSVAQIEHPDKLQTLHGPLGIPVTGVPYPSAVSQAGIDILDDGLWWRIGSTAVTAFQTAAASTLGSKTPRDRFDDDDDDDDDDEDLPPWKRSKPSPAVGTPVDSTEDADAIDLTGDDDDSEAVMIL